jgi:hypothetical protein
MQEINGIATCMIDTGNKWDGDMGSRMECIHKFLDTNCTASTFTEVSGRESLALSIGLGLQELFDRRPKATPILHIGCEGDSYGINFASEEVRLEWRELIDILQQVNDRLGIRPILCLAGNHPFKDNILGTLKENETPPFSMVIDNTGEVTWTQSIVAYMSFYHILGNYGSVVKAVKAMKMASGNSGFYLEDEPSKFFEKASRKFDQECCSELIRDLESMA